MPILCRELAPPDAQAFQALRLRGLQECPDAFASSYDEEFSTPLGTIESRLAPRPDGATFGAFDGQRLVAVVGLVREHHIKLAHKAFIWGMYVVPESRRSGAGAAILGFALEYAVSTLKVRQVNLGVNAKNTPAVSLYRRLGFEQYGLERDFLLVAGEFHDEYQMVWRAPRRGDSRLGDASRGVVA